MKTRKDFVTNSSSISFLITNNSVVGAAQNDMAMGTCLWIFWRAIIKEKP